MAELPTGLHLVELPNVVDNLVEQAHAGLQQLSSSLPSLSDEERKRALLRYLHTTRQQLQRLHVAVHWSNKAKAVAEVKRLLEVAANHGSALRDAADQLAYLWGELEDSKAPLYDVPTAVHVLESGSYKLLPTSIEEQAGVPPPPASEPKRRAALRRMDFLLRSKLLATKLPEGMVVMRVKDGTTEVAVPGQYSAELTLVPAPRDEVTLAKYRPPAEAEQTPAGAGPRVDVEVTQRLPEEASTGAAPAAATAGSAGAMEVVARPDASGPAAAAGAGRGSGSERGGSGPLREADRWRWLLVSLKLLPEWESDTAALAPNQAAWLQRHLEDKMWRAADAQQLRRLGAASVLLHFPHLPQQAAGGAAQQAKQSATQQGPAASQPRPSGSMLSSPPTAAGAAAEASAAPADQAVAGAEVRLAEAAAAAVPDWAVCPLSLLHSVLRQAAGRLTVYSLVLTEARRLEKGAWEGMLRISRSAGTGLRFAYWLGRPLVTYGELCALRTSGPAAALGAAGAAGAAAGQRGAAPGGAAAAAGAAGGPGLAAGAGGPGVAAGAAGGPGAAAAVAPAAAAAAPALEVNLEESGALDYVHSPPLFSPLTGQAVRLRLAPASLSIEELLLAAAAHNAATQLAAVQAVLEADGRWAPLGISLQLVPPPSLPFNATSSVATTAETACLAPASAPGSAAAAAAAGGGTPSLLFRATGDPSPFLALSVALKTARLSLMAGPALQESWGEEAAAGGQPGAGTASSALTALVAAAQQRVERCEKDALTLPLAAAPTSVAAQVQLGGSRGVLAAGLVAGEVAALCRRLVRRRRLAMVAAAARGLGLLTGLPLPLTLLQEYLSQLPVPRAAPLASDALTLALPSFQAPPGMVSWEQRQCERRAAAAQALDAIRQHRQRIKQMLPLMSGGGAQAGGTGAAATAPRLAGSGSLSSAPPPQGPAGAGEAPRTFGAGGECGAVRTHLLVEYQDDYEDDATADSSAPAAPQRPLPLGSAGQRRPGSSGGGEEATLQLSLVVSSCTARGTVKQVLKLLPVPPHVLSAPSPPAAGPADAAAALGTKRKRGGDGEEEHEAAAVERLERLLPERDLGRPAHALSPLSSLPTGALQPPNGCMPDSGGGGGRSVSSGSGGAAASVLPLLEGAVRWCREASVWEQMLVQLRALKVPFLEEWRLPPLALHPESKLAGPGGGPLATAACRASGCQPGSGTRRPAVCRSVLRLPCPPALATLEAWAAEQRRARASRALLASPDDSTGHTECSAAAAAAGAGAQLAGGGRDGQGGPIQPEVLLEMDPCNLEAGAWTATVSSSYLAQLPQLFSQYGVRVTPSGVGAASARAAGGSAAGGMELTPRGVALGYEQRRGESGLTAVGDVLRMLRLHTCVARLASLMLSHPLGPHRPHSGSSPASHQQPQPLPQQQAVPGNGALGQLGAAGGKGGGGGKSGGGDLSATDMWVELGPLSSDAEGSGQLANGYYLDPLPGELPGAQSAPAPAAAATAAPRSNGALGGGSMVKAEEGGVGGLGPPAPEPGAAAAAKSSLLWALPLCATVALEEVGLAHAVLLIRPSLPPGESQQARQQLHQQLAAPIRVKVEWVGRYGAPPAISAAGTDGGRGGPGAGGGLVRCRVTAEPALPAPMLEALEAQLEAGCEPEFLDCLCLAAAAGAELCRATSPGALRAAGLLPGVARLGAAAGAGGGSGRSALRLALRAQHVQRALHLQLEAGRGSYTLIRLMGPRGEPYADWAEAAWASVCQLPTCHAAPDGAAGLLQAKQAWCGLGSLGAALAVLLQALAAGEAAPQLQ